MKARGKLFPSLGSFRKLDSCPNGPQLEGGLLSHHIKKKGTLNFCNDVKHLQLFWQHNGAYCSLWSPWWLKGHFVHDSVDKGSAEWKLGYMWSTKLLIRLKWIFFASYLQALGERRGKTEKENRQRREKKKNILFTEGAERTASMKNLIISTRNYVCVCGSYSICVLAVSPHPGNLF